MSLFTQPTFKVTAFLSFLKYLYLKANVYLYDQGPALTESTNCTSKLLKYSRINFMS